MTCRERSSRRRSRGNGVHRGSAYVEYLIVVTFTGVAVLLAVRAFGPELASAYSEQRNILYRPYP